MLTLYRFWIVRDKLKCIRNWEQIVDPNPLNLGEYQEQRFSKGECRITETEYISTLLDFDMEISEALWQEVTEQQNLQKQTPINYKYGRLYYIQ